MESGYLYGCMGGHIITMLLPPNPLLLCTPMIEKLKLTAQAVYMQITMICTVYMCGLITIITITLQFRKHTIFLYHGFQQILAVKGGIHIYCSQEAYNMPQCGS